MGQLQADQKAVGRAGRSPVLLDQHRAQPRQALLGVEPRPELIGIGASIVPHRDRLATPDQLGATASKSPPAANRAFRRIAVGGPVPTFHRLNGDAVADFEAFAQERLAQRRFRPAQRFWVARECQSERV